MGSSTRPLAEACRQLAIRQAPGNGESVSLQWCSGTGEVEASATLEHEDDAVMILYRWREAEGWRTQRRTIALKFDVPHLGGIRRFWRCSNCGLGARRLYDVGDGEFRCRRCGRLTDKSQRIKTWRRALRRAAKIRSYLASDNSPADPFPAKPKRMRWAVYEGLRAEAERLEALPAEAWLTDGRHVALGVRRGMLGASKRRWWPSRNCRPGLGAR